MGENVAGGLKDIAEAMQGFGRMMSVGEMTKDLKGGPYYDTELAKLALERHKIDTKSPLEDLLKYAQIENLKSTISTRAADVERKDAPLPSLWTKEGGPNPEALKKVSPSVQKEMLSAQAKAVPPSPFPTLQIPGVEYATPQQEFSKIQVKKDEVGAEKFRNQKLLKILGTQIGSNALDPEALTKAIQESEAATDNSPFPGESWEDYKARTGQL